MPLGLQKVISVQKPKHKNMSCVQNKVLLKREGTIDDNKCVILVEGQLYIEEPSTVGDNCDLSRHVLIEPRHMTLQRRAATPRVPIGPLNRLMEQVELCTP